MKRLVYLLAICLSFAALADIPMWQRNNGAWEAVVRVNKEAAYYDFYDFRAVTNGMLTITFPHKEETNVLWRVDYDVYTRHRGTSLVTEYKQYSFAFYAIERIYPVPDPMAWTNDLNTIAWKTNNFAEAEAKDNGNIRYDYTAWTVVRTNVVDVTPLPISYSGNLPCRLGVPASVAVNPPYTDLLEMLPLNWPETYIRIRTGFDGYLLIRFEEAEMRLTIKRLLPEKLPYEQKPRSMYILRDDALNGV
jgi:hypothetical protein